MGVCRLVEIKYATVKCVELAYVSSDCSLSALVPSPPPAAAASLSARTPPPLYVRARILGIKPVRAEVIDSFLSINIRSFHVRPF